MPGKEGKKYSCNNGSCCHWADWEAKKMEGWHVSVLSSSLSLTSPSFSFYLAPFFCSPSPFSLFLQNSVQN